MKRVTTTILLIIAVAGIPAWAAAEPAASPGSSTTQTNMGPAMSAPAYPLKVSANGRYLVDRNNVPFLIAGDSPHLLVKNLSEADAELYFASRQAHGFNAAWVSVVFGAQHSSRPNGGTYDGILPFTGYIPGGTDLAHYDLTKPNPAYFTRADHMITLAANHGITVFFDPMETAGWLKTLRNNGTAAAYTYGQYMGNRYKGFPNIVWISGNDFGTWKTPGDDAVVQAVANGIRSVDPGHLQTVELYLCPSTQDPTWRPLISINTAYTYAATYVQMLQCYNQTPTMPVFLGEAHYEGEQVGFPGDMGTPSVARRQSYWTMLSGGAGQLWGNYPIWAFDSGWKKNLDTPGATQFACWRSFMESLPWYDLVPDQTHTVVTDGLGKKGDQGTRVSQRTRLSDRSENARRSSRGRLHADRADDHCQHGGFEVARQCPVV